MTDNAAQKLSAKERKDMILRALKMNEQADKGYTLRKTVIHLLALVTDVGSIILLKYIINAISQGRSPDSMLLLIAGYAVLSCILNCAVKTVDRRQQYHEAKRRTGIRNILSEKIMQMDYSYLDDPNTQDKYQKAKNYLMSEYGVSSVPDFFAYLCKVIIQMIVGIVLIIPSVMTDSGAGFICSPWGFLTALAAVIIFEMVKMLVFNERYNKAFEDIYQKKELIIAERVYNKYLNSTLRHYQSGKEIRIYSEQELILEKMKDAAQTDTRQWLKAHKEFQKYLLGYQLMSVLSFGVMYGYAILRALYGTLSAGEVIAFVMLFQRVSSGVTGVSDMFSCLRLSSGYCKEVFDFLDIPNSQYKGTIPTEKRSDNEYEFEFSHVYFKYPGTENYVLKDINLKWKIGEKMALVGQNGCGKSTLVKLLCRLYDPTEGQITLNGIDIRKYDSDEYMALFSIVFQDSGLFSFSIAENVAASTQYDAEKVEDCIRRSGLSERLDSLPDGIGTYLYKDFDENGIEISGGESQKLCLARAIYKGAPFIVLDEPTAALDPISEYDIYTKFNGIVGTRTAIYISHRLSSCRFCDEITVMNNGEIVERGSHETLLAQGGYYTNLWSAQAEYYKDTAGELYKDR